MTGYRRLAGMAYRDDLAALEARKAAAEAELVEKTRARDELVRLVDEARYLARAEAAFAGNRHDLKRGAGRRRRLLWLAVAAGVVVATYERAMCACAELEYPRSSECALHLVDDMTRWSTERAKEVGRQPKLDDQQMKRATAIGESMAQCMANALAPPTTRSDLPDAIDSSMISAAIASVRAQVTSCGEMSSARGRVELRVWVDSGGRVAKFSVELTPAAELGFCVAAAVQTARFPKTQNGGSFSYPFEF